MIVFASSYVKLARLVPLASITVLRASSTRVLSSHDTKADTSTRRASQARLKENCESAPTVIFVSPAARPRPAPRHLVVYAVVNFSQSPRPPTPRGTAARRARKHDLATVTQHEHECDGSHWASTEHARIRRRDLTSLKFWPATRVAFF
jgi:hypothetical protein